MPHFIALYNPGGLAVFSTAARILTRGLSRDYAFAPHWTHYAQANATTGGRAEVELYADGSGLEVAWRGRLFVLGVERIEPSEPRGVFAALRCFASFVFVGRQ